MRYLLLKILLLSVGFDPFSLYSSHLNFGDLTLGAEEVILMNAKTGKVLFEKNGYQSTFPASTTKVATALVVLKHYQDRLNNLLTVEREAIASISPLAKKQSNYRNPPYWIENDSSHMGLKRGEELPLYDLLCGMLIASANDAANVIAQSLGGTIPKFMDEVNDYLKSIACQQTHFNNPHGLHHPDHVTTAYDLALMAKEGLKDPIFRRVVSIARYNCPQTNLEEERVLSQSNLLLKSGAYYYPKAIGVKTGTTQVAGKNLIAAAQNEEREIIAVLLGYRGLRAELYSDAIKLFDAAFNEQKFKRTLLHKGELKKAYPVKGANMPLITYLEEDLSYEFFPSENEKFNISIAWKIPPLPILQASPVGKISVLNEQGDSVRECTLLASHSLYPTLWHRLQTHYQWILLLLLLALLLLFIRKRNTLRYRLRK